MDRLKKIETKRSERDINRFCCLVKCNLRDQA